MSKGIELIAQERKEQIEKHGRTVESDIEMKNFEELKQAIKGNSFNESHLSNTQVVDLETVIGLIEDFEQCNIANVVGRSEQLPKNNRCVANLDEICDCDTVCIDLQT